MFRIKRHSCYYANIKCAFKDPPSMYSQIMYISALGYYRLVHHMSQHSPNVLYPQQRNLPPARIYSNSMRITPSLNHTRTQLPRSGWDRNCEFVYRQTLSIDRHSDEFNPVMMHYEFSFSLFGIYCGQLETTIAHCPIQDDVVSISQTLITNLYALQTLLFATYYIVMLWKHTRTDNVACCRGVNWKRLPSLSQPTLFRSVEIINVLWTVRTRGCGGVAKVTIIACHPCFVCAAPFRIVLDWRQLLPIQSIFHSVFYIYILYIQSYE